MRHFVASLIACSAVADSIISAQKNSPSRIPSVDAFSSAASTSGGGLRGSYSSDNNDDGNVFESDSYLANWMGAIAPALANSTLLDMTLPGTHDTMSYDLTTVIADGGVDNYGFLSKALHDFSESFPNMSALEYTLQQAQSQTQNVTAQLDNGVRFLDFRIMYTSDDWYCLHMVQSKDTAYTYLTQVRAWLDAHPTEIITLWLSKHGNECATGNEAYAGIKPATKQAFWAQVEDLFAGVMWDNSISSPNETTYPILLERQHRALFWASDYLEFTGGGTPYAQDGCHIDNTFTSSIGSLNPSADLNVFANANQQLAADQAKNRFFLLSMANSPPGDAIGLAMKISLDPTILAPERLIADCASAFHLPGMSAWCPPQLMDVSQLTGYYKQQTLEAAFNLSYRFPNAVYIDALATGGHVRTGLRRLSDQSTPPGNTSRSSGNNSSSTSSASGSSSASSSRSISISRSSSYGSSDESGSGSGPICALFQWTPCLSDSEAEAIGNGGCSEWVNINDGGDNIGDGTGDTGIGDGDSKYYDVHSPSVATNTTTTTPNGDQSPWKVFDSSGKEQGACNQSQPEEAGHAFTFAAAASLPSSASSSSPDASPSLPKPGPTSSHRRCCRNADSNHASDSFAYADLLIAATAQQGCAIFASKSKAAAARTAAAAATGSEIVNPFDSGSSSSSDGSRGSSGNNYDVDDNDDDAVLAACSNVAAHAAARYWKHPVNLWDDPQTGRIINWPEGWFVNGPPPKEDTYDFLEPGGST